MKQLNFYQVRRRWPEGYASLRVDAHPNSKVSHLDVYKGPCNEAYLRNYTIINFREGYIPDLLPNNLGWMIVSPRCRKILESIDAQVKATLVCINSIVPEFCPDVLADYSLVSATLVLDCLDVANPDLDWFDSSRNLVRSYEKLPLLCTQIPKGVCFFGVLRVPGTHVVSEPLRDSLTGGNLTGLRFSECQTV